LSTNSTLSHIKNAEIKETKYQAADLITISQNRFEVENIESIRSDVETGSQRNLVRKTSISGNIGIYHSMSISA